MRKFSLMAVATALFSVASYGQATTTCNPDENNPSIGTPYEYRVNVADPAGLSAEVYTWYVTQQPNLLQGTVVDGANNDFFTVDPTGSPYNNTTAGTNTLKLTWKPDALTSSDPFFLVLKYKGHNGVCDVHNMKAMKIKPLNNFKLTIEPTDETGNTSVTSVCAPQVSEATYDTNENKVKYLYGKTTLYYKVSITGYQGRWKPTIYLPVLGGKDNANGKRKYEQIQWKTATSPNFVDFATFTKDGEEKQLLADQDTDQTSFILKVVIDNGTHEGLDDEKIKLSTKGQMVAKNGLGARDVDDNCQPLTDTTNKFGEQTIKERPEIQAQAGTFITELK